ncbi:MAG TPA: phosphomannomutase/phosphoglucomutase [Candidatus Saccharimonadales bacterium]|nr:phosphomannomutase/phosphoglucomutase [Candidatus Saccharimonadales bacterium]
MDQNLDNIFKAYDIRGKVGSELSPDLANDIGKAFADWLPQPGIVAVGRDMRPDSAELADSLIAGLREQGRHVWDIGQVTSDMIYFAVGKYNLAGGAVVTASHNPGAYNGIKLYRDKVIAIGLDSGLSAIRDATLAKQFKPAAKKIGSLGPRSITKDWVNHCLTFIDTLKPFHIAIDAGNGMAGAILPKILPMLPLRVEELYFDLDGTFPNHEANPQKPENLKDLINKVVSEKLDFGIAFDGDGDRAGFVDDLGRPVLGTDLISIVAKLYLEKYPGSEIIHEVRTSRATQELIREWGGKPVRTKAGRVVIGTVMRKHKAAFGGETTGHLFFKENYDADSGLIAALVAVQAISNSDKKLSELVNEYRRYVMMPEVNFEVTNKLRVLEKLRRAFKDGEQDELDGLTVNYPDYWFNIRISNTEPVMRLNAEAKTKSQLDKLLSKISSIIMG